MEISIQEVVLDCAEPERLAEFWGRLLECGWGSVDEGWAVVEAVPILGFQKVPEPKSSPKNRIHLDIEVPDIPAAVERAETWGARTPGEPHHGPDGGFQVMLDPEDNEFCLVADPHRRWRDTLHASVTHHPA